MEILTALVGSRAHDLNNEDSDFDWRGIYITPTSEILSLDHKYSATQWIKGKEDIVNYEVGHFIMLATKANPSILELLVSPNITFLNGPQGELWGKSLLAHFPYFFNPTDAFNAFIGYSYSQRKKLMDESYDKRKYKYCLAYIRTLYNLIDLLATGIFSLKVENPNRKNVLMAIKYEQVTIGGIINLGMELIEQAKLLLPAAKNRQDLRLVNDLLLKIRKENW